MRKAVITKKQFKAFQNRLKADSQYRSEEVNRHLDYTLISDTPVPEIEEVLAEKLAHHGRIDAHIDRWERDGKTIYDVRIYGAFMIGWGEL